MNDYATYAYPKGVSIDYYINLFWGGLKGSKAYDEFEKSSLWENYKRDRDELFSLMSKKCTN